jgi:hypothetical protein
MAMVNNSFFYVEPIKIEARKEQDKYFETLKEEIFKSMGIKQVSK